MNFKYIKSYYGVPAEIGREVKINGESGIIVEDRGNYIGVNFHKDKPGVVKPAHPTWEVEYLGAGKIRKVSKGRERYAQYLSLGREIGFDNFIDFCYWDARKEKEKRERY